MNDILRPVVETGFIAILLWAVARAFVETGKSGW